MKWLARLKKIDTAPSWHPTETTKRVSVGFVGTPTGHIEKTGANLPAANDPTPDLDRWCWPHSDAMNSREIDTFTARLHRFTDNGQSLDDAEKLADMLVKRDRDLDDRRLCLECVHLSGHAGSWGCSNGQRAGLVHTAQAVQLSTALVHQLQRCDGFKEGQV